MILLPPDAPAAIRTCPAASTTSDGALDESGRL
jgi:hypothetical protein